MPITIAICNWLSVIHNIHPNNDDSVNFIYTPGNVGAGVGVPEYVPGVGMTLPPLIIPGTATPSQ